MHRLTTAVAATVLALSSSALAQVQGSTGGQGWSVLSGRTVGAGGTVVHAQAGWPGISIGLLHGASPRLDVGGRFTFNYGQEGIVRIVEPGIKLQGLARLELLESPQLNLGVTFSPGPFFYFHSLRTLVGLTLPVGLTVGVPVGSNVIVNAGLDLPFYVTFGTGGGPVFPILVGGGLEYFIDRRLALTLHLRMGPSIYAGGRWVGTQSYFTLESLLGLAYRL